MSDYSYSSASHLAKVNDCAALDHLPTCPSCGNLCGMLAEICADCGARLKPTEADLRIAAQAGEAHDPSRKDR